MRDTVPSRPFATQTASGLCTMPAGPPPTVTVCRTVFVSGSTRETEFSSVFVTQTASFSAETPLGARPTGAWAVI